MYRAIKSTQKFTVTMSERYNCTARSIYASAAFTFYNYEL